MTHDDRNHWIACIKYKLAAALALFSALGCYESGNGSGSGETHFLRGCSEDAGCASGLECVCGVCTVRCDENSSCEDQSELASCRPSDCSEERICDVECAEDGDCADLGSEYTCNSRRCRTSIEHTKDAASPDGETIDAGPTPAACLGTERVEEITRFTLEHTGGIPTPCSDGSYDSNRYEKYEVDLTRAVVTYDLAINCQPAETGTTPLTDDQIAQIQSTLTDLEPQTAQTCMVDYGEGTLSIPGCGEYKNEASNSACGNSELKVLPLLEFDALIEIFQKIALAATDAQQGDSSILLVCTYDGPFVDFMDNTQYERNVSIDEQTAFGFSVQDLSPIIGGTHAGRLVWQDGTETRITFTFEYDGDDAVLLDMRDVDPKYCSSCLELRFQGQGVLNSNDESFVNETVSYNVQILADTVEREAETIEGSLSFQIPELPELNGTFDRSVAKIDESTCEKAGAYITFTFNTDGFDNPGVLVAYGSSDATKGGTSVSVTLADIYLE